MAMKAAKALVPFWYEPEGFKDTGTRFHIRGLSGLELYDVNASATLDGDKIRYNGTAVRAAMRNALLGWEGLVDEEGQPIPFNKIDPEANLAHCDFLLLSELFGQVIGASNLGGDRAKN